MTIEAIDVAAELGNLPILRERTANTPADAVRAAFTVLAPYRDGAVFAGSFSGDTSWERHRAGDELVQIVTGAATLTVITDDGPQSVDLRAGMLIVVPQGRWHRFHVPDQVTVLSVTPQPTEHTTEADPR